jgi:ketosteroid isomerase-like protein
MNRRDFGGKARYEPAMHRTIAPSIALALAGCAGTPSAPAAAVPTPDPAALRASLEKAELAFATDSAARGVDAWVDVFADDGMILTAGSKVIRGKAAIREAMAPALASSTVSWHPVVVQVAPSGDMGFTYGPFEWRSRANPGPIERKGSFMTVWKRSPDGRWQVAADIGSTDAP